MKPLFILLLIIFPFISFSQWNSNAAINTAVATATKAQQNTHMVPDASGGAIIVWEDNRNSTSTSWDIYAQRMNASGIAKWNANGLSVCSASLIQKNISVTEVPGGNAIITWEDTRNGNSDIYAQKIDSLGNSLWALDGIPVCNKTTAQKSPKIISDNAGGAIIVWEDSLNFYWDICAQRISSSGTAVWAANGVTVCSAPNTQNNPKIDIDNAGGGIITWQDKRNNTDYDIYAQRLNASGVPQWTADGVVICNAINTQNNPRIDPDGSGGAAIAWEDKRNGLDYDIYLQRVNASGAVQWTVNGVLVCGATSNQSAIDMKYIGAAGFVVSWKDKRSGSGYGIYSQLMNMSGVVQLATNGVMLSSAPNSINPNAVSDGQGVAIIAWQDSVAGEWQIRSQKMTSSGALSWTPGGADVCIATDNQINVAQVCDGNGGAVFAWDDHRNTNDYDIYAHHLYYNGMAFVGIIESSNVISSVLCYPNPIKEGSVIRLNNNTLPFEVTVYNSFGSLIDHQNISANNDYHIPSEKLEPGCYFYSVNLSGNQAAHNGRFIYIK